MPDGLGILIYYGGGKYVGEWKDGDWNGQGTFDIGNGEKYVGEWKNDSKWNGTEYNKKGYVRGNWVNGEYIKQ